MKPCLPPATVIIEGCAKREVLRAWVPMYRSLSWPCGSNAAFLFKPLIFLVLFVTAAQPHPPWIAPWVICKQLKLQMLTLWNAVIPHSVPLYNHLFLFTKPTTLCQVKFLDLPFWNKFLTWTNLLFLFRFDFRTFDQGPRDSPLILLSFATSHGSLSLRSIVITSWLLSRPGVHQHSRSNQNVSVNAFPTETPGAAKGSQRKWVTSPKEWRKPIRESKGHYPLFH